MMLHGDTEFSKLVNLCLLKTFSLILTFAVSELLCMKDSKRNYEKKQSSYLKKKGQFC